MPKRLSRRAAEKRITEYYRRNGYMREQNEDRLAAEGYGVYKKGDEIRLVAQTDAELEEITGLLTFLGFKHGRPFVKGWQLRVPVYGREQVAQLVTILRRHW